MKSERPRSRPPGFGSLVAAGEPFRLLFPLGAVIGVMGVLLWPLFAGDILRIFPGPMHARIMIEGFLTCFVLGFLGTALPRLMDARRLTVYETLTAAVALCGIPWLHFRGQMFWGDVVFFVLLGGFSVALAVRFADRRDTPPPAFVLVAMGLASALAGTATLILAQAGPSLLPAWLQAAARLLVFQGYVLLPVMGIGAFLLPRFFGAEGRQEFPESRKMPAGWKRRAGFALTCGIAVLASFALEARGEIRWGMALRAAAVVVFFVREIPFRGRPWTGGSLALGLRLALLAIPLGYALMAVRPERAFSFLHIVFISGFGLLTFIVASRVVLGHGGRSQFFTARLISIQFLTALLLIAMLTRVTADGMPAARLTLYASAALTWVLAVVIWAAAILPGVLRPDGEN